ncbi:hypothetical protein CRX72_20670 [Pantoea sp. BRM17]|nr:hypothetical protein CRX72_20670 [Pantoea sp. BRM17]
MRLILFTTTALITATIVSMAGSIGFVGLVVPHVMRFFFGPLHKRTILAGVAASQLFNAVTAYTISTSASAQQARDVMFWLLGSFSGVRWPEFQLVLIVVLLGLAICLWLQSLLKNALAEPYVLGVSAGASTGAVAIVILGLGTGAVSLSAGAFAGAFAAFAFVAFLTKGARSGNVVIALGISVGELPVPLRSVFYAFSNRLGLTAEPLNRIYESVIWDFRLSRALVAACCGAGLAICGAVGG